MTAPVIALSERQKVRDSAGLRDSCAACGHHPAERDPLVISDDGFRIHLPHVLDPSSGYYGTPFAEAS